MTAERVELIALVERIIAGHYADDADLQQDVSDFQYRVLHPRALGLIYHWADEFETEPSSTEIVDRALAYRPIEL
jgi:hypothetical protein